jgi:hypothetical protein
MKRGDMWVDWEMCREAMERLRSIQSLSDRNPEFLGIKYSYPSKSDAINDFEAFITVSISSGDDSKEDTRLRKLFRMVAGHAGQNPLTHAPNSHGDRSTTERPIACILAF